MCCGRMGTHIDRMSALGCEQVITTVVSLGAVTVLIACSEARNACSLYFIMKV